MDIYSLNTKQSLHPITLLFSHCFISLFGFFVAHCCGFGEAIKEPFWQQGL